MGVADADDLAGLADAKGGTRRATQRPEIFHSALGGPEISMLPLPMSLVPTTWVASLTSMARLFPPPRVPRSRCRALAPIGRHGKAR